MALYEDWVYLNGYADGREVQGSYTSKNPEAARWVATVIECPYCHGKLTALRGTDPNRVAKILEKFDNDTKQRTLMHAIPRSHQLVRCATCRQGFTVPKERTGSPRNVPAVAGTV